MNENIPYLKATLGRLKVQSDNFRNILNNLHENKADIDSVIFQLDTIITEYEIRKEAKP